MALAVAMPLIADTEVVDGIEWTYTVSDGKASVGLAPYYGQAIPASAMWV